MERQLNELTGLHRRRNPSEIAGNRGNGGLVDDAVGRETGDGTGMLDHLTVGRDVEVGGLTGFCWHGVNCNPKVD